jgi:hypothetical protein
MSQKVYSHFYVIDLNFYNHESLRPFFQLRREIDGWNDRPAEYGGQPPHERVAGEVELPC